MAEPLQRRAIGRVCLWGWWCYRYAVRCNVAFRDRREQLHEDLAL